MGAALPAVALATGIAGAGVSAIGAISSGQAQAANANYQAQVAKNNATIAGQNAEYATQAGAVKAESTSLQARDQEAKVRVGLAASGIDVNSGSAADVETTQRETGSLSTQTVVDNAALQAYGYRTTGTSFTAEAGLDTAVAAQAPGAALLTGGGGLLSNISSVGNSYAKLQQQAGLSS